MKWRSTTIIYHSQLDQTMPASWAAVSKNYEDVVVRRTGQNVSSTFFHDSLISGADLRPHKERMVRKIRVQSPLPKNLVNAQCISHSWEGLISSTTILSNSTESAI